MIALTRWRFGRNRRLVMAVTWVPMPPCFLGLPLRQMMLPFIGPLPVNSQNFPIVGCRFVKGAENVAVPVRVASVFRGVVPRPQIAVCWVYDSIGNAPVARAEG